MSLHKPISPEQVHPAVSQYLLNAETLASYASRSEAVVRAAEGHIVCGDALEVLARFPAESVDLVHTSPPYNIDKPYESDRVDRTSDEEYQEFLCAAINELKRIIKPGGAVFWQTGYTQSELSRSEILPIDILSYDLFRSEPNSLQLWDRIIWRYWGGHAFTKKFTNKHETLLWFVKPGEDPTFSVDAVREKSKEYDKRNNFWGRNPGNVWEVDRVAHGSSEQTSHIAVFPEEISERIVRACSKPSDLVMDPFSGSGTVAKVAQGASRRWIGIEVSPLYAYESCVRVGYQQPSDSDSLASELVKRLAFQAKPGTLQLSEVIARVSLWAERVPIEELWNALNLDIDRVFSESRSDSRVKRDVWMKYDRLMKGSPEGNAVALADMLLSGCYKLRQQFNGVTRFRSALTALTTCLETLNSPDYAIPYVSKVATQEPSSFALLGSNLTLVSPHRKVGSNAAQPHETLIEDSIDDDDSSYQARLLL